MYRPNKIIRYKLIQPIKAKGKTKIFCIGRNKSGTTSLFNTLEFLGYTTGHQRSGEKLLKHYLDRNFTPIINFCKTAEVFNDVPFSLPLTYKILDEAFPDAKFILTVRDTPEQWFNSTVKYYSLKFGKKGKVPTAHDLKESNYIKKGWMYDVYRSTYDISKDKLYEKDELIKHYINYNKEVINYFNYNTDKLLVINVAKKISFIDFVDFIGIKTDLNNFFWYNKT